MSNSKQMNRRRFVKLSTGVVAGIPLLASRVGSAQDELVELTEDDPTAQALGYKTNVAEVDLEAFPNAAGQNCANCALYTGVEGEALGPCGIFPGKLVHAEGWCSVHADIPA